MDFTNHKAWAAQKLAELLKKLERLLREGRPLC